MAKGKGIKKIAYISIIVAIMAVVIGIVIAVNCVLVYWDTVVTMKLGTVGGGTSGGDTTVDTNYFKSDYSSDEELIAAQKAFCEEVSGEGIVMLKNDGALPLANGARISLFGLSSVGSIRSGSGSGASAGVGGYVWVNTFASAGYQVNRTLVDFYANSGYENGKGTTAGAGDSMGDWSIGEVPQSKYTSEVKSSYADYKDAAVIILSRGGGEGGDLPREMSRYYDEKDKGSHYLELAADRHYLELSVEEEEMIKAVKSAGFGKTLLIVNSANAMELGFVNDPAYGIDACLWTSGLGEDGVTAIGKIVKGDINPSGKLVDTYVYDNLSSPAMQNFGDYRYVDASGELTGYSYVNYGEGVYVGYKYYETRYEDSVLGTENVGAYDYDSTVVYPFGYGLSYSAFSFSDYACDVDGEAVTVSVKVTNDGPKAGKEVVQVYFQSPYTPYDKTNKVEKPAVSLVEFAKTELLEVGASETVTVSFSIRDMASYDAYGAGTYILESSEDYYITAATDAHRAVNNILAAKGYAEQLSGTGDAALAKKVEISADGADKTYGTSLSGGTVSNQFGDAYVKDYTYLTRSNWAMMDGNGLTYATGTKANVSNVTDAAGNAGTVQIDSATLAGLKASGYAATGAPAFTGSADYTYSATIIWNSSI